MTAVVVPTVLVGAHAWLYGRWIVDDAAITFAYARSVATGAGPVLQPGAVAVEGYSNPAWMAILVVGRWLGLFDHGAWFGVPDYVAFPKAIALVCVAGAFACFYAIARVLSCRPVLVTVVAGCVAGGVPSFVMWCFSGLENPLLAVTVVGIAAVLVRAEAAGRLLALSTAMWCGLLAAVAALTRPDGIIYAGAYGIAVLVLLRRETLARSVTAVAVGVVAFAVPAGAYLMWRLETFGEYLPNTALAKSQDLPSPGDLGRPGELVAYVGWLTALLAAVCLGAVLARPARIRRGLILLVVPLGLAVTAFAVLAQDWMEQYRFATPVWPLGALTGILAAAHLIPQLATRGRAVIAVVAVVAAVLSGVGLAEQARVFRAAPTVPLCLVVQHPGRDFNVYAEVLGLAGGTLLAPDIGGPALTSRLQVVDLVGLADAQFARYWRAKDMPGLRNHVFSEVRPTFITSHGSWSRMTGLPADPRMAADFAEIATLDTRTAWVRRDILGPGQLELLRRAAVEVVAPADEEAQVAPRRSCGDTLTP